MKPDDIPENFWPEVRDRRFHVKAKEQFSGFCRVHGHWQYDELEDWSPSGTIVRHLHGPPIFHATTFDGRRPHRRWWRGATSVLDISWLPRDDVELQRPKCRTSHDLKAKRDSEELS